MEADVRMIFTLCPFLELDGKPISEFAEVVFPVIDS